VLPATFIVFAPLPRYITVWPGPVSTTL
jgi:hypothetical protein